MMDTRHNAPAFFGSGVDFAATVLRKRSVIWVVAVKKTFILLARGVGNLGS
jgi:hypothetical protein